MKRFFGAIIGLLALACFISCLIALNWIWAVKQPVIEKTNEGFDQAEKYLAIADKALNDVKASLTVSRAQMQLVSTVTRTEGDHAKPGFMNSMIAPMMRRAIPNVAETQRTLEKVTEASIVVNSILDSLQDSPLDSKHKLETKQVTNLQTQLDDVTKASWELGGLLEDPRSTDGEQPGAKSERIAAHLGQVISLADELQARVNALQTRVSHARKATTFWMDRGPTLATVGLLWVAFSQIIVMWAAARTFRRSERA